MITKTDIFLNELERDKSLSYEGERQMSDMVTREYKQFKCRLYPGPGF